MNREELSKLEDRELIRLSRRDPRAFACLYRRYYQQIFNYIYRRTLNVNLTKDLTANTFFAALKAISRFRWRGIPFSSWLYRVATNEINLHFRRRRRFPTVSLDAFPGAEGYILKSASADTGRVQEKLEVAEEYQKLHAALLTLSPLYQTVIGLRFFAGRKIREISQITGRSEGTVKSQLHRGLEQLREILEKDATFSGFRNYSNGEELGKNDA